MKNKEMGFILLASFIEGCLLALLTERNNDEGYYRVYAQELQIETTCPWRQS